MDDEEREERETTAADEAAWHVARLIEAAIVRAEAAAVDLARMWRARALTDLVRAADDARMAIDNVAREVVDANGPVERDVERVLACLPAAIEEAAGGRAATLALVQVLVEATRTCQKRTRG